MKIGYLITYFLPFKGGMEQNCLNLAMSVKDSNEVQVFTSDRKLDEVLKIKEDNLYGIKIRRYRPLFRYRMYFVFYPKLFWDLIREDLDIVHVHGFGFGFHDVALVTKKLLQPKTRFINTPHGPVVSYESNGRFAIVVKNLVRIFEKFLVNWIYDDVIAVNSAQYKWMKAYGISRDRIRILPNGLSKNDIKVSKMTIDDLNPLITQYDLVGKTLIVYVGRFSYYKGVEHLVEAYSRIVKNNDKVVLGLIGRDDGHLDSIKEEINRLGLSSQVLIFEDIDEKTKFKLINLAEVLVLPSEWEAFGIVLLEGMICNTAVISTATEGGIYVLKDSQSGLLYNYGDIDALTSALEKLVNDYKYRAELKDRGYKRARAFTWDKIGKSYQKLLEAGVR